jgi:hypothetical protein
MTQIPAGTKFVGIGATVPTPENRSSQNNAFQEVYTLEDLQDSIVGSDYTETIVNILPTETTYSDGRPLVASGILAMGTSPIELLPQPGANKYYDWYAIVEYTFNTEGYSVLSNYVLGTSNTFEGGTIQLNFLGTENIACILRPSPSVVSPEATYFGVQMNDSIVFTTWGSDNPTLGDGTMRVKIYHKTITFGA